MRPSAGEADRRGRSERARMHSYGAAPVLAADLGLKNFYHRLFFGVRHYILYVQCAQASDKTSLPGMEKRARRLAMRTYHALHNMHLPNLR
jgi:hypothetical protein